jgi:prepilin-type processing-associated H-X9-DG protein
MAPPAFLASYGFNYWVLAGKLDPQRNTLFARPYTNVVAVREKGRFPVLLDCTQPASLVLADDRPPPPEPKAKGSGMGHFCLDRHNGSTHGLFLDWSVRKVGLKELWTLKWRDEFNTAGPWTRAGGVLPEDWPKWMRRFKDY